MGKIRGTHSSPGIYTKFTDISYSSKSLGITTLGLVGETQMGPAFEAMPITNWEEFVKYYGSTNADKFKGSKYPKYELPYVAKEYLSVSDQMYVCRVLGLSGYNAGPMFIIKGLTKNGNEKVIAVLRAKGSYETYATSSCDGDSDYDTISFKCNYITLEKYKSISTSLNGCNTYGTAGEVDWKVDSSNTGKFNINCWSIDKYTTFDDDGKPTTGGTLNSQPIGVSLDPNDTDYIYNVLGSNPIDEGTNPYLFVEELYDVMLDNYINGNDSEDPITAICSSVTCINDIKLNPVCNPVSDVVNYQCNASVAKDSIPRTCLGKTYIYDHENTDDKYCYYSGTSFTPMETGGIYTVKNMSVNVKSSTGTDYVTEKRRVYVPLLNDSDSSPIKISDISGDTQTLPGRTVDCVKVLKYDTYVYLEDGRVVKQLNDLNDYKEGFRCAITPWTVSEVKGGADSFNVYTLFRFYTISDGNSANNLVKISILNIDPEERTFDVYVRDFNDTDSSMSVLESFRKCSMVKGSNNYIGLKIGTVDGSFESKSKYILVEVNENEVSEQCVPSGFLGYPVRTYPDDIESPTFTYNKTYDNDINKRKQYFGLSDITGVDVDMLSYKGKNAYTDDYTEGYTNSFHLDSRLDQNILSSDADTDIQVLVDGDEDTSSIIWETVDSDVTTDEGLSPVIGTEEEMAGTIYEDKNMRKFTFYPYGGFDGWDIYRETRTNSDKFKANKYKGKITNGYGQTFSKLTNPESYALTGNCITSDYYAYLAGINQFENTEKTFINVFATPGIDYVNNQSLCDEVIEMMEDTRGDCLYIVTTPDKPFGAEDAADEMYTSEDVVMNLEDSEIDTYYAATYYPWVKYYDTENNIYINLPVTKDVVRNLADVDNKRYPWYAPAGIERGNVNCTKAHLFSKLEEEDTLYDGRINPVKTFSKDGVKIWGNKTMYTGDTPMNRINVVRLMLYMRKLIIESCRTLIFEPNDATLKSEFENIVKPILDQIQKDRGITAYRLDVSQTTEQMDAHELSCVLWVKPTPALEYIEINFMVTPQSVDFDAI